MKTWGTYTAVYLSTFPDVVFYGCEYILYETPELDEGLNLHILRNIEDGDADIIDIIILENPK